MEETLEHGVPELRAIEFPMLKEALRRGWADMKRSPGYSIMFASAYVVIGLVLAWITWATGKTYWLIFAAVGFPLVGPFAACGFYEVSRCLEQGKPLEMGPVCGVVARQGRRQLPSLCAVIIMIFLFWFFLAHMIFALFMGLSTMTNVSSSFEVFLTANGLMMLLVGTAVGAVFALLLFMITVIAMPRGRFRHRDDHQLPDGEEEPRADDPVGAADLGADFRGAGADVPGALPGAAAA